LVFIDAHVHIHDCFNLEKFFDSAYQNFLSAAKKMGTGNQFCGILLMAEAPGNRWFDHLENYADGQLLPLDKTIGQWMIRRMPDKRYLMVQWANKAEKKMILMAGWQLCSAEGLEVLALVTRKNFENGIPIASLMQQITEAGALPVIPWGFGKWMGSRGRILKRMLSETIRWPFFLGDNQQRPLLLKEPLGFRMAAKNGFRILPGSDPFPFRREQHRAGAFGFFSKAPFATTRAGENLLSIAIDHNAPIFPYGCRKDAFSFLILQTATQIKKISKGGRLAA
jgi:hypothetical protein